MPVDGRGDRIRVWVPSTARYVACLPEEDVSGDETLEEGVPPTAQERTRINVIGISRIFFE